MSEVQEAGKEMSGLRCFSPDIIIRSSLKIEMRGEMWEVCRNPALNPGLLKLKHVCSACLAVSLSPETYIWLDEFVILTAGSANAA
jgi:hypothetical protein